MEELNHNDNTKLAQTTSGKKRWTKYWNSLTNDQKQCWGNKDKKFTEWKVKGSNEDWPAWKKESLKSQKRLFRKDLNGPYYRELDVCLAYGNLFKNVGGRAYLEYFKMENDKFATLEKVLSDWNLNVPQPMEMT